MAADPEAVVTKVVAADYPRQNGDNPNDVTIIFGGLQQPRFIILDLADGTRRTVALNCGPETVDGLYPIEARHATEFDLWRVSCT